MKGKNDSHEKDEIGDSDNESPNLSEQYERLQQQRVIPQFAQFKSKFRESINPPNVPSTNNTLYIAIVDDNAFPLAVGESFVKKAQEAYLDYVLVAKKYRFPADIKQFKSDLEGGHINGILTDHDMPEMTGSELIRYVRSVNNDEICRIPMLLNSADTDPDKAMSKMLLDNEVPFVKKPIAFESVRDNLIEHVVNYDQTLKNQNSQNFKA